MSPTAPGTADDTAPTQQLVLMLHGDEAVWQHATEADRRRAYAAHEEFARRCAERGHRIIGGAEVAPAAAALVVRQQPGGAPEISEGPFTRTVEQLGGYYVVETPDARDLARLAGLLVTGGGAAELRPVVTTGRDADAG